MPEGHDIDSILNPKAWEKGGEIDVPTQAVRQKKSEVTSSPF
jgi:hypothetical protein